MPQQNEKISKFLDAIHKDAEKRREVLERETEAFKQEEIRKAESEALREAYALIQHEMEETRLKIARDLSTKELSAKRSLLEKREEIMEKVFGLAREKLLAFSRTPEYKTTLFGHLDDAAHRFGSIPLIVSIRPEDEAMKEEITAEFPAGCEVKCDGGIKLGGAVVFAPSLGKSADYTLDKSLAEQRAWFRRNSGLFIA